MANAKPRTTALKAKLFEKIEAWRPRIQKLNKEHGNVVIDSVNIGQAIGGARDVRCLVTDISYLDPQEGIRFRGKTIPETFAALPRKGGHEQPTVEAFFYFLLTGDVPTPDQAVEVEEDWRSRAQVPAYVFDVLRALPRDTHPMTMLSTAVLSMQRESVYARRYAEGMKKNDYWDPMYEDAMNLLARLPQIAAYIYRMKYKGDTHI
ncbi:MAG TPA: citrate/2-methylcitrate synthase, partial [Anaeromyxobacteraceae bacterium]|nr:citrate/2-methylcitrate synthase [Anaeromyxobacteraceae bacterium]